MAQLRPEPQPRPRGLNVLGNLGYTPTWATTRLPAGTPGEKRITYTPDSIAQWVRFVQAAVQRYPEVRYWSIWNEPNDTATYFRGDSVGQSRAGRIRAYNKLVAAGAPVIRASNQYGRGYVVGLELSAGDDPALYAKEWLQGVLGPGGVGDSLDRVAVHHYARRASDSRDYLYGMVAGSGVTNWRWPVWVTEVGMFGCNESKRTPAGREALGYCYGPNLEFTNDDSQATYVAGLLGAMQGAPASSRWDKTFYFHSHLQVFGVNNGVDWGLLRGAGANDVTGRPSFTTYARVAGPLLTGGATYGYNEAVPVTALPAVVPTNVSSSAAYDYVWEYRWCSIGGGPYSCPSAWHPYNEGLGLATISPWVDASDFSVHVRVRQYTPDRRTLVGDAWHFISRAGQCQDPTGNCPILPTARAATAPADTSAPATGTPAGTATSADLGTRRTWGARGQPRRRQQGGSHDLHVQEAP